MKVFTFLSFINIFTVLKKFTNFLFALLTSRWISTSVLIDLQKSPKITDLKKSASLGKNLTNHLVTTSGPIIRVGKALDSAGI